jgi:YtoQ family protein
MMTWTVYLSGEIHSAWREEIERACDDAGLDIEFTRPVTDHEASDAAGDHLGAESSNFWRDHKSAKVNSLRIRQHIETCDVAVIRFGDTYKQWNAAFDAGYCAALNKPYITLHDDSLIHPLKEVDASAIAWAQTPEHVVDILKHTLTA